MNVQSACEWCGDCLILYPLASVPAYRLYSTVPLTFLLCVSVTDVCDVFEAVQSVPYCRDANRSDACTVYGCSCLIAAYSETTFEECQAPS